MIFIDSQRIACIGDKPQIMTELTHCLRDMYIKEVLSDKDLETMMKAIHMTTEELRAEVEKRQEAMKEKIPMLVASMLSGDETAARILNRLWNKDKDEKSTEE